MTIFRKFGFYYRHRSDKVNHKGAKTCICHQHALRRISPFCFKMMVFLKIFRMGKSCISHLWMEIVEWVDGPSRFGARRRILEIVVSALTNNPIVDKISEARFRGHEHIVVSP